MKKLFYVLILVLNCVALQAIEIETTTTIVINNVQQKEGVLFVAIFNSAESFKKRLPFHVITLETEQESLTTTVFLPPGEYLFSAFQDLNNNGKADSNFFGFPREPIGIANYSGKGLPGSFDKHKVLIEAVNQIIPIVMKIL